MCHGTSGASQTQHYGMNNTYRNNIFSAAYQASWTDENSAGIRSVAPSDQPSSYCWRGDAFGQGSFSSPHFLLTPNFATAVFENNIVYVTNSSTPMFLGVFVNDETAPASRRNFTFRRNLWWSTADPAVASKAVWGGCNTWCQKQFPELTWAQWQGGCGTATGSSPTNCTGPKQDQGSRIADPRFKNPAALDFTLPPDSPAFAIGFQPIDVSNCGPVT